MKKTKDGPIQGGIGVVRDHDGQIVHILVDGSVPVFQGDMAIVRVAKLPKEAQDVSKTTERHAGGYIVAHSETGHHHTVDSKGVTLFQVPGDTMRLWARLDRGTVSTDVVHHRSTDTHKTFRLLAEGNGETIYEIRRQREHTPWGDRRVED